MKMSFETTTEMRARFWNTTRAARLVRAYCNRTECVARAESAHGENLEQVACSNAFPDEACDACGANLRSDAGPMVEITGTVVMEHFGEMRIF